MKQFFNTRSQRGFTIVELMIVIVIIAVLAVLVFVAYNTVTKTAVEASMRSDLESARTAIALMKGGSKNYPETAAAANNGEGLRTSGNNQLIYGASGTNYSVAVINPATTKRYCLINGVLSECNGGIVTSFVGARTYSIVQDGTGSEATFSYPISIATGPDGSLYVGDCGRAVRKITPAGVVTTFAGSLTTSGYYDAQGTNALLRCVLGITVDQDGNVYFTQGSTGSYHSIRKITPSGDVTTIAGSMTTGATNANGTSATFFRPYGIFVDDAGVLYIAEDGNNRIRKIDTNLDVSTVAGSTAGAADGNGESAQFDSPIGIVKDSQGNLFVTDRDNRKIRKIAPNGDVTTFAGSGVDNRIDGVGTAAAFGNPTGITIDEDDNLYVTDNSPYAIRKITPDQVVTTIAGEGTWGYANGIGSSALFGWMDNGITFGADGFLYVTDSDNYLVRKVIP